MSPILDPNEVQQLAGGYQRPAEQLRKLKELGYWRAWQSPITGQVIVERAHYHAVATGQTAPRPGPKLRAA